MYEQIFASTKLIKQLTGRQGSTVDRKTELESRYIDLLEKRIAALEALLPATVGVALMAHAKAQSC